MMTDDSYRIGLRNHLMGKVKNSKFQSTPQHFKDHVLRSSGGDADRTFFEENYASNGDYYHSQDLGCMRPLSSASKPQPSAVPFSPSYTAPPKFHPDNSNTYMYETDSNMGGNGGVGSEESNKSQKSCKTVVSRKSSRDLRKMVQSQCKLHEVIDKTLKHMCSTEPDLATDVQDCHLKDQPSLQLPMPKSMSCKRCRDKVVPQSSQKDVMTEIPKGDFLECRSGDTLTISVDDVVNSKVINPMIRKLQRMYLNNLREEMSLMEDLERLPHKVNEVYKATIFKQKD